MDASVRRVGSGAASVAAACSVTTDWAALIGAAAWVRRGIGRFSVLRDTGLGSPAGGHGAGQARALLIPSVLQLATRDFRPLVLAP